MFFQVSFTSVLGHKTHKLTMLSSRRARASRAACATTACIVLPQALCLQKTPVFRQQSPSFRPPPGDLRCGSARKEGGGPEVVTGRTPRRCFSRAGQARVAQLPPRGGARGELARAAQLPQHAARCIAQRHAWCLGGWMYRAPHQAACGVGSFASWYCISFGAPGKNPYRTRNVVQFFFQNLCVHLRTSTWALYTNPNTTTDTCTRNRLSSLTHLTIKYPRKNVEAPYKYISPGPSPGPPSPPGGPNRFTPIQRGLPEGSRLSPIRLAYLAYSCQNYLDNWRRISPMPTRTRPKATYGSVQSHMWTTWYSLVNLHTNSKSCLTLVSHGAKKVEWKSS